MSSSYSKRKAPTQDEDSSSKESCKRRKTCSNENDVQNWEHDVFPSFHGTDVRENILSHMLASFKRKGINPFIDEDIERGKSIGPELIKAIRGSKIAIVLLSQNYASSSWCLDELAEIIKCREELNQIVMPIFYKVHPTDVKKQTGDFGEAFRKTCEDKPKDDFEKWRKALKDVATIAGEHFRNWTNEAVMIEEISTDVSNKLTLSMPSRDFDDYFGMRAHVEKVESLLCLDLDEVRMIGIWGPSGIGKTTIARVLFNQFSSRFQLRAIMVNIKEFCSRLSWDDYNTKLYLLNKMLSEITDGKDMMIPHFGEVLDLLNHRSMLLILDGVDMVDQLVVLAQTSLFGVGSRIIVTTDDRQVLRCHGINDIYKVKYPSSDEALQIFCLHAFGQKQPDDGFEELARKVSYLAGELPLGLTVLRSSLRGKIKQEWEMMLPKLKTSLDGEIESILEFSYNSLHKEYQHIFLCIACFFNNQTIHKVEELLAKEFTDVKLGLHILAEKSLISVYQCGRIEMHALLVQAGKKKSRKREFLDNARDISEMLSEDTTDTNHPIAINVVLSDRPEDKLNPSISDKALQRMWHLQFVRVLSFQLPTCEILQWQSLIFYSQKIRSLNWTHFPNICLPSTFNPTKLVELVLRFSKLQMLWQGLKELGNLKWIDLSSSRYLKELPDLSTATNLEELFLLHCSSLEEIPNLSTTTKLTKLILGHCSSLVKLPSSIGDLSNLENLDLSNCSCLVELPSYIGTAANLERLDLSGCSKLVNLPFSIGDLINLVEFDLSNCSSLVNLPPIGNLQKLQKLTMCGCSKLEALPTNINLISLDILDLTNCSQLKSFPEISTNIVDLNLKGTAIEDIPLTITSWPRLHKLNLQDCHRLNQEARDLIMRTSTRNYAVLPGTEVPACFNYRATAGGLLTVNFYEMSPLPTHLRFNACITLVEGKTEEETSDYEKSKYVKINMMARRNDQMVSCGSSNHLIGDCLIEQHLYIFEVVAEDVTSAELTFKFNIERSNWKIRKCGLMLT